MLMTCKHAVPEAPRQSVAGARTDVADVTAASSTDLFASCQDTFKLSGSAMEVDATMDMHGQCHDFCRTKSSNPA